MTLIPNSPEARDVAYMLHPYTNFKAHEETGPMIMERGKGVYVWDTNGKKYLEGMAGLWSTAIGFDSERLAKAAYEQMLKLPYYHTFASKSHLPGIDLAEKLLAMMPVPMSKVFFNNSGSEANDTAIKIIWYYNNARGRHHKKKIIGRKEGYHGITVAAGSLTGKTINHAGFDLPIANFIHVGNPHHYKNQLDGESEEQFATRMAEELDALIVEEGPDTVAAMFAEPIQGAGGVIVPPATYWEKVQAVLKKHDVLLVADEVICGFGRTGNPWGSQTMGMKPDILTCAKALSSSYLPISATVISETVYEPMIQASADLGAFGHGYTYSGHPVCAAVALENLKIFEETDLFAQAAEKGKHFQARFNALADHPLVGEVRGRGLVGAAEIVQDKTTREAFDPKTVGAGALIGKLCTENGLITRPIGEAICFCPPLVISKSEIDELFDLFEKSLNQAVDHLKSEGQAVA